MKMEDFIVGKYITLQEEVQAITVPKINIDNAMTYEEYTRNVGRL